MRLVICLLVGFAVVASAQTYDRDRVVSRLNADLANLKDVPANSFTSLVQACLGRRTHDGQRSEECGPVDRISEDLSLIHPSRSQHYPTQGLTFNLISFLAGRALEPDALSLFTNSLVDAVAIADRSIEVRTRVSGSRAFRDSVMRAYAALFALGVDRKGAELLLGNFVRTAERASTPPDFIPIPPAPLYK